jgi:hypothetical protein
MPLKSVGTASGSFFEPFPGRFGQISAFIYLVEENLFL